MKGQPVRQLAAKIPAAMPEVPPHPQDHRVEGENQLPQADN